MVLDLEKMYLDCVFWFKDIVMVFFKEKWRRFLWDSYLFEWDVWKSCWEAIGLERDS